MVLLKDLKMTVSMNDIYESLWIRHCKSKDGVGWRKSKSRNWIFGCSPHL